MSSLHAHTRSITQRLSAFRALVPGFSRQWPLGARLARSAPLAGEELVHLERRVTLQHVIDRTCELVCQDGQGLTLAVLFLQPAKVFLSSRIGP